MDKSIKDLFVENIKSWLFEAVLVVSVIVAASLLMAVAALIIVASAFVVGLIYKALQLLPIPIWCRILVGCFLVISILLGICYLQARKKFHNQNSDEFYIEEG